MQAREYLNKLRSFPIYKYLLTLMIVSFTALVQHLLWPLLEPAPFVLFFPAVLFCCFYGNGTFSIILSAIFSQFFFVPPYDAIRLVWPNDHFRLLCFCLAAMLIEKVAKKQIKAKKEVEYVLEQLLEEKSARENFVSALSHDLQTPLTAIRLSTQLLERKPEDLAKNRERIIHNVTRIEKMVQDILDANKLRAGVPLPLEVTEFNLIDCIQNVASEMNLIHHNRIVLSAPQKIMGFWSLDAVRRIAENLCTNAIKYGEENKPVSIVVKELDAKVEIEVHNEGQPIPSNEQDYLFNLYKRALSAKKSGKKGWGLGLTLVKGFATSMGGDVRVKSLQGFGTSFIVTLPKDVRSKIQAD
ncbi:ATP-binding protein [Peredibacter starrii]|uniref:histidine kinase n=2 Tax=Peredibacter starrii TaxID=28202 RepID=A0AAX4HLT0_9BACT|nr:ATP-binding protein [Peredibacter starrii]WPU64155.1 ATP-binding protein [Peredibacter starrii]